MSRRRRVVTSIGSVAAVAASLVVAGSFGGAQEASPAATVGPDAPPRPAAIVAGACDAPGDVVFQLTEVAPPAPADGTPGTDSGDAAASGSLAPQAEGLGEVLALSNSQIQGTLGDILAAEHAVVVYADDEQTDLVACGPITGGGQEVDQGRGDQALAQLDEQNASGLRGLAILTSIGPGATTVSVLLSPTDSVVLATPESTPAP